MIILLVRLNPKGAPDAIEKFYDGMDYNRKYAGLQIVVIV